MDTVDMRFEQAVRKLTDRDMAGKGLAVGKRVRFTDEAVAFFAKARSQWHPARPEVTADVRGVIVGVDGALHCVEVEFPFGVEKCSIDWLGAA